MMEKWILWIGLLAGCCACTESKPTIGLDNCDVVAVKKVVGKDTVIVCEQEWKERKSGSFVGGDEGYDKTKRMIRPSVEQLLQHIE